MEKNGLTFGIWCRWLARSFHRVHGLPLCVLELPLASISYGVLFIHNHTASTSDLHTSFSVSMISMASEAKSS